MFLVTLLLTTTPFTTHTAASHLMMPAPIVLMMSDSEPDCPENDMAGWISGLGAWPPSVPDCEFPNIWSVECFDGKLADLVDDLMDLHSDFCDDLQTIEDAYDLCMEGAFDPVTGQINFWVQEQCASARYWQTQGAKTKLARDANDAVEAFDASDCCF